MVRRTEAFGQGNNEVRLRFGAAFCLFPRTEERAGEFASVPASVGRSGVAAQRAREETCGPGESYRARCEAKYLSLKSLSLG
jgi:hypothetical protein